MNEAPVSKEKELPAGGVGAATAEPEAKTMWWMRRRPLLEQEIRLERGDSRRKADSRCGKETREKQKKAPTQRQITNLKNIMV